ncbi:MAG: hypothetical protein KJ566_02075 [Nanoarchaeota archaeon]|nr:hypothetical protein [Nanoarchaeota archaeon]
MVKYRLKFDTPLNEFSIEPMLEFLKKRGYNYSFTFNEGRCLSATLSIDKILNEENFEVLSKQPHTIGFVQLKY